MGPRQGDDAQERRKRLVVPDRADSQNAQSPAKEVGCFRQGVGCHEHSLNLINQTDQDAIIVPRELPKPAVSGDRILADAAHR